MEVEPCKFRCGLVLDHEFRHERDRAVPRAAPPTVRDRGRPLWEHIGLCRHDHKDKAVLIVTKINEADAAQVTKAAASLTSKDTLMGGEKRYVLFFLFLHRHIDHIAQVPHELGRQSIFHSKEVNLKKQQDSQRYCNIKRLQRPAQTSPLRQSRDEDPRPLAGPPAPGAVCSTVSVLSVCFFFCHNQLTSFAWRFRCLVLLVPVLSTSCSTRSVKTSL